jgi:hypothetical protein
VRGVIPRGYHWANRLDLIGDPSVTVLRRDDKVTVAYLVPTLSTRRSEGVPTKIAQRESSSFVHPTTWKVFSPKSFLDRRKVHVEA